MDLFRSLALGIGNPTRRWIILHFNSTRESAETFRAGETNYGFNRLMRPADAAGHLRELS